MRVFLLFAVLVLLFGLSSAQYTVCQNYSGGASSNSTTQVALLTAIVTRAAVGGVYTSPSNTTYLIPGLFNSSGPLYNIFSGATQYRYMAPNYTSNGTALAILANKLVAYFGALFGCTATGYPAVSNYNMYLVHANMSINSAMENYFNTQLALTLLSFGVDPSVVNGPATQILGWFNRCGAPVLGNGAPVQICGTSDCTIATNANYSTCIQYYAYPYSSSSSSSSTGSVPVTPTSNYPAGSYAAPLTVAFTSVPNATYGASLVRQDIAYNIATEGNATAQSSNFTVANVLPYVVITSFNGQTLAPSSRRLLQTTTSVPVQFIVLGNITTLGGALSNSQTVVNNLATAAKTGLAAPYSTAAGGSIPTQTITPFVPGSQYSSSSSSSTGSNGASGKYAAGGLFVAAAAIVASLVL